MVKHLVKHGNSLALVIDKPILELLRITEDTPLHLVTDGQSITIAPAGRTSTRKNQEFHNILASINQEYGEVLSNLAK